MEQFTDFWFTHSCFFLLGLFAGRVIYHVESISIFDRDGGFAWINHFISILAFVLSMAAVCRMTYGVTLVIGEFVFKYFFT